MGEKVCMQKLAGPDRKRLLMRLSDAFSRGNIVDKEKEQSHLLRRVALHLLMARKEDDV